MEQKYPSFFILNDTENTKWYTVAIFMIVYEEAIRKATGIVNAPLELRRCTNSPRYHVSRFLAHSNFPNKMYLDMAESAKRSIQEYAQHNLKCEG